MASNLNKQKQDADEDKTAQNVKQDGYSAEELGEASAYDSTNDMAQQMRRGDESKGDPNKRDAVGSSDADTKQKTPR